MMEAERLPSLLDSLSEALDRLVLRPTNEELLERLSRPSWSSSAEDDLIEAMILAMTELATLLAALQRSSTDAIHRRNQFSN